MTEVVNGLWADISGISSRYGICRRSTQNLMNRRILPYVKIGRIVRFDVAACDAAMKKFEIKSVMDLADRKAASRN